MSSRQTGSRYDEGSNMGLSGGVNRNPATAPLIAQLFGQDKITGGLTQDAQGNYGYTPEQGSSGFLGGWSRGQARQNNNLYGSPMMLQQLMGKQRQQISAQEATQEQARMQLESRLHDSIMKSAQLNTIATQLGVPIDQLAGQLSTELAANAIQKQQNVGKALKSKDVQDSENTAAIGQNTAQDAINRQRLQLGTGIGGVATMPGAPGQPNTTVYGGTRKQETTQFIDPLTGLARPITREEDIPGRASIPIPQGMMPPPQGGQQQLPVPTPQTGNLQSGIPPQQNNSLLNYINGQQGIASGMIDPNSLYQPGPSPAGNIGKPAGNTNNGGSQFGQEGAQGQQAAMQLLQSLLVNPQFGLGQ